ncbi:hypothetical protein EON68_01880, partial [archaeon]
APVALPLLPLLPLARHRCCHAAQRTRRGARHHDHAHRDLPGTDHPDNGHPGTGHHGTGHPGTGHPGTGHHGTGHHGTDRYDAAHHGCGHHVHPCTAHPRAHPAGHPQACHALVHRSRRDAPNPRVAHLRRCPTAPGCDCVRAAAHHWQPRRLQ